MRDIASDNIMFCPKCNFLGYIFHGIGFEGCDCKEGEEGYPIIIECDVNLLLKHPKYIKNRGGFVADKGDLVEILL